MDLVDVVDREWTQSGSATCGRGKGTTRCPLRPLSPLASTPHSRHARRDGFEINLPAFFADRYELVAFRNVASTYIRMNRFCFRITFQNEDAAFYQFHVFPPVVHMPWVSGWARKRNASTQLILVELKEEEDRDRFLELCCENPHVLKIEEISEDEFTATPSQAI